MKHPFLIILLFYAFFISVSAFGEEADFSGTLLGDWHGERHFLLDNGIEPTLEYKADVMNVASGGLMRTTSYLDNTDMKLAIDGQKLLGLDDTRAFLYLLNNSGGKPGVQHAGSLQGIDNIEVEDSAFKLYEAWVEHSFFDKKLSLLVGIHDLNSEFDETDASGNFIAPPFQIGEEFAQSGRGGPSIFPNTSLAARIKITPTDDSYLQFGAFDALPANYGHNNGINARMSHNGTLLIAEAGLTPSGSNMEKMGIGGWIYTQSFDDLTDMDAQGAPIKKRSAGTYLLTSHQFYQNKDTGHSISAFLRTGLTDANTTEVDWTYAVGITGNGWLPGRPEGEIGLGLSQAHNSSKYVRMIQAQGESVQKSEYAIELYYRDSLYHGIAIEPDIQYLINPDMNPGVANAVILGLRLDITF